MPVFLNGGNVTAMHQMNFGALTQNTLTFLNGQLEMIQQSPHFAGMAELAKLQFEQLNGDHARSIADAVIRASESVFDTNAIRPLRTMAEFQLATPVMQRWLMTSQFLQQEAAAGRINGWSDTFVDHQAGLRGVENNDWQLLHQGMIYEMDGGDWAMKQYFAQYQEGEVPLTLSQRVDVLDAISFAEAFVKQREEDPTSPYGDFM